METSFEDIWTLWMSASEADEASITPSVWLAVSAHWGSKSASLSCHTSDAIFFWWLGYIGIIISHSLRVFRIQDQIGIHSCLSDCMYGTHEIGLCVGAVWILYLHLHFIVLYNREDGISWNSVKTNPERFTCFFDIRHSGCVTHLKSKHVSLSNSTAGSFHSNRCRL